MLIYVIDTLGYILVYNTIHTIDTINTGSVPPYRSGWLRPPLPVGSLRVRLVLRRR